MIQQVSFSNWNSFQKTNGKVVNSTNTVKKNSFNGKNAGVNLKNVTIRKDPFGTAVILELGHSFGGARVKSKRRQSIKQMQTVQQRPTQQQRPIQQQRPTQQQRPSHVTMMDWR
jgi:hypothetical protein